MLEPFPRAKILFHFIRMHFKSIPLINDSVSVAIAGVVDTCNTLSLACHGWFLRRLH